jgi:hypothetical protein
MTRIWRLLASAAAWTAMVSAPSPISARCLDTHALDAPAASWARMDNCVLGTGRAKHLRAGNKASLAFARRATPVRPVSSQVLNETPCVLRSFSENSADGCTSGLLVRSVVACSTERVP